MNNPKPALRFRVRYPDLGTDPIPVEVNTSPEYFEREREKIFKHAWWCVGREDEIPPAITWCAKSRPSMRP